MSSPSPVPGTAPTATRLRPRWTQLLGAGLQGVVLARERFWLLTWDGEGQVSLLSRTGQRQGQARLPGLTAACIADDGSACGGIGRDGHVWWLAPDLTPRWQRTVPGGGRAAALDPFGQYLAVADSRGEVHLFDRHGRTVWKVATPRPLSHLAFVPGVPLLVGAADYGLVLALDMQGQMSWRDGLVAHVGAIAVDADGEQVVLACFGQGLIRYDRTGQKRSPLPFHESCRRVAASFDGRVLLVAGVDHRLFLLTDAGQVLDSHSPGQAVAGLALAALGEQAFVALAGGTLVALDIVGAV